MSRDGPSARLWPVRRMGCRSSWTLPWRVGHRWRQSDMHEWELEALDVASREEIEGEPFAATVKGQGTGSAWIVSCLYGSHVWRRWGVGLVEGSLNLAAHHEIALIEPVEFQLSEQAHAWLDAHNPYLAARWRKSIVCPVVVDDAALGFIIRGLTDEQGGYSDPSTFCEVFAPMRLTPRLGLKEGQQLRLMLVSGSQSRVGWEPG